MHIECTSVLLCDSRCGSCTGFHGRLKFLDSLHVDIVLKPGREVSEVAWALHVVLSHSSIKQGTACSFKIVTRTVITSTTEKVWSQNFHTILKTISSI